MSQSTQASSVTEKLRPLATGAFDRVSDELVLNDERYVWYVESGRVDVFFVELESGRVVSSYKHVSRATAGRLLFCLGGEEDQGIQVRLKGFPGFSVRQISRDEAIECLGHEETASQVDRWLEDLAAALVRDVPLAPRFDVTVSAGDSRPAAAGEVISSSRGVVWVSTCETASYLGTGETGTDLPRYLPLTLRSWATYLSDADIETLSSEELHEKGLLAEALTDFHSIAVTTEMLNRKIALVDIANLQLDSSSLRDAQERDARLELKRIASPGRADAPRDRSPLLGALKLIGEREQIEFTCPDSPGEPALEDILVTSAVRAREVNLNSEPNWWMGDSFSMLGFRAEDGSPVALIPGALGGGYLLADAASGATGRLGAKERADLEEKAFVFYRPLPRRRAGTRDVMAMLGHGLAPEVLRFVLTGLASGLVSFLPAFLIGLLTDYVLPAQSPGMLWTLTLTLAFAAMMGLLLTFMQSSILLKMEARAATRLTAAVWDRILSLPPNSLQGISAGEITARAMVFQNLRERASGLVTSSILSVMFLLPTLFLLFFYDTALAVTSLVTGIVAVALVVVPGILQFHPQRVFLEERQKLSGTLFQFINGIQKLRSAGAEQSAFAFWVEGFARQKRAEIRLNRLNEVIVAITSSVPLVSASVLFAVTLLTSVETISLGEFFIVFATAMMFFGATTRLGNTVQSLATFVPEYQQVLPILERTPEDNDDANAKEIDLHGELRFDHVTFSYPGADDPVLVDVSIHVEPGEFVAIVGESGSGKTTLLNLAIGLEKPDSGAIYYDSHNVSTINRRSLRRKIGTVSQNGALQPGTILKNIIGISGDLGRDDAWAAAKMAAVDKDIRKMHMQMQTPVGDSSANFSGGQVQRILIAAAIVRKPRVIFLDEATNWLDNNSQAEVMTSIASLAATRIVIAHRLSTIRQADRIYVLDKGRVVQSGTYGKLAGEQGLFRQLIKRQLLEDSAQEGGA